MMREIIRTALGMLLVFFLPGYLLSVIIIKRLNSVERFCLSIGLSLAIAVMMGINLSAIGYLSATKAITGRNLWVSLLIICALFSCTILIMHYAKTKSVLN